jgi:uncharacterized protein (TIGR02594 family)
MSVSAVLTYPEPAWLLTARLDIGQNESLGPNDSPWIRTMWAALSGKWLLGQPWCGGALANWMQKNRIPYPKDYYRAKAWLNWGVPIAHPVLGCVVVFERTGGGHVGLCVGQDIAKGALMVLGGNQGNKVSVLPFDPRRVLGYRWPSREFPPSMSLPYLASNTDFSTNEA